VVPIFLRVLFALILPVILFVISLLVNFYREEHYLPARGRDSTETYLWETFIILTVIALVVEIVFRF